MRVHIDPVDPADEIQHVAGLPLLEHHIIKGQHGAVTLIGGPDFRLQHQARFGHEVAGQHSIDGGYHLIR